MPRRPCPRARSRSPPGRGTPAAPLPPDRTPDVAAASRCSSRHAVAPVSRAWAGLLVTVLALSCVATAGAASLPEAVNGVRPGPAILYADPPRAPQLENTGPWKAAPILVSGASAYRDGEFLYQDFLFDDRGAAADVPTPGDETFAPSAGRTAYPSDPALAGNAADLVELRVKPLRGRDRAARDAQHAEGPGADRVHRRARRLARSRSRGRTAPACARRRRCSSPSTATGPSCATPRPAQAGGARADRRGRPRAPAGRRAHPARGVEPGRRRPCRMARRRRAVGRAGGRRTSRGDARLFNLAFRFDEPIPDVDAIGRRQHDRRGRGRRRRSTARGGASARRPTR